jgi:signal peptidase II
VAQGSNTDRRRVLLIFLTVGAGVTLIDQVTKHLSVIYLENSDPVRLLWGAVYLTLVRNSGAAFSLGSGYTWVFPLVTIAVVTWIAVLSRRLRSTPWALALGLVLGGALGNLIDRLFRAPGFLHGHVVDMVSLFGPYAQYFAVFNVADSCLSVGVVLAVLLELTGRQRDGTRTPGKKK